MQSAAPLVVDVVREVSQLLLQREIALDFGDPTEPIEKRLRFYRSFHPLEFEKGEMIALERIDYYREF